MTEFQKLDIKMVYLPGFSERYLQAKKIRAGRKARKKEFGQSRVASSLDLRYWDSEFYLARRMYNVYTMYHSLYSKDEV